MNKIKSTYDKFKCQTRIQNILFVYSSLMKIVYFLENYHKDRDIEHSSIDLLIPHYFIRTEPTNKQTNKHTHTDNRFFIIFILQHQSEVNPIK